MSEPIPVHLGAKAIGEAWLEDSSLERWFPITAQELASLRAERDAMREALEQCESALAAFLPSHPAGPLARDILTKTKTP